MPVHLATISATMSASTSSGSIFPSFWLLQEFPVPRRHLLLDGRDLPVADLGGPGQVPLPLALLASSFFSSSPLFSSLSDLIISFSRCQWFFSSADSRLQLLQFIGELPQPLLGMGVLLPEERLLLDLQLDDPPLHLVDLGGHGVDLDPQARGRLVDQVDGLVRQEPVGDVAVRQGRCGDDGTVLDPDAVEGLVLLLETPEDGDGVLHAGSPV